MSENAITTIEPGYVSCHTNYNPLRTVTIGVDGISTNQEISTSASGGGTVKLHSGVDNGLFVQNRLTDGTNQEVRFILNNNSNAGIYDVTKQRWALVYNVNNG